MSSRRLPPTLGIETATATKGTFMPLINVKLIEGVFTGEQKQQMIERLTDAMVSIEGENMRQVTWCVVEEVKSGDWGIAGNALTVDHVRALAAGAAA
jgi:4-oxalocrotonate tautomerase